MRFDAAGLEAPAWPIFEGAFEVRARGARRILSGVFPYEKTATIRAAGRVRKERFKSGSMSWQVREFEKLQADMAEAIKATMDKAAKAQRIERWRMRSNAATRTF